jgi:hypothetical protein
MDILRRAGIRIRDQRSEGVPVMVHRQDVADKSGGGYSLDLGAQRAGKKKSLINARPGPLQDLQGDIDLPPAYVEGRELMFPFWGMETLRFSPSPKSQ